MLNNFDISINNVFPEVLLADFPMSKEIVLSEYSTSFKTDDKGRVNNITIAAKKLNNTVIKSNKVFSFNKTLGPTNKANGYKTSKIFKDGKTEEGVGGGVCQVSSTLFNAVETAGLEIIERHEHSKDVYYVPEGKDAATSYGGIDFKFKNNKNYSIKINSFVKDDKVTVKLIKE